METLTRRVGGEEHEIRDGEKLREGGEAWRRKESKEGREEEREGGGV